MRSHWPIRPTNGRPRPTTIRTPSSFFLSSPSIGQSAKPTLPVIQKFSSPSSFVFFVTISNKNQTQTKKRGKSFYRVLQPTIFFSLFFCISFVSEDPLKTQSNLFFLIKIQSRLSRGSTWTFFLPFIPNFFENLKTPITTGAGLIDWLLLLFVCFFVGSTIFFSNLLPLEL